MEKGEIQHNVLMVCDFFYPQLGGVELHMYQLSLCLLRRGHKVVIVTHSYGKRTGVRYMTDGLKVYYLPLLPFVWSTTLPTVFFTFPIIRQILIREKITIVHGHQATSVLAHESIFHAGTMGLKTVYTDHSLFGFNDAASIHLNKVVKFSLSDISHVICVSHTGKENLCLRASVSPVMVSVIPNAVDATKFVPDPTARWPRDTLNIVIMSRLVYRKGIDLAVAIIPAVCRQFPNVHFIIGGDGPKRLQLEEMREKYQLQDRVELLGAVPHAQVRNVLVRGHIFLNCSLTEAFCIAILEAACAGLYVVSTRVGGVPEVLPPRVVAFAEPTPEDLLRALTQTIPLVRMHLQPFKLHAQVKDMYNWNDVAARTEKVYDKISKQPSTPLIERLRKYNLCGLWAGKLFCLLVALDYLLWCLLEWLYPRDEIDKAVDFPYEYYSAMKEKLYHERDQQLRDAKLQKAATNARQQDARRTSDPADPDRSKEAPD